MSPNPLDEMLETMMNQLLQPAQNAASAICCSCFKLKETCCKCLKKDKSRRKRRRRKKKSCLKTIVCVSKIAKDRRECQGCSCDPCCSNAGENHNERICSMCGQQLPGFEYNDQPLHQPDQYHQQLLSCQQQLDRYQQGYNNMRVLNDMGVQVDVPGDQTLNTSDQSLQQLESCKELLKRCQQEFSVMRGRVERQEPLSVRIKVCPCPNTIPVLRNEGKRVSHSAELSRTNPRLLEEGTSENLAGTGYPKAYLEGNHYDASHQSLPRTDRLNETSPEWRMDTACIKRLAMKMAMAQLVEEVARRERERVHQDLEQSEQKDTEDQSRASAGRGHEVRPNPHTSFEEEQLETLPGPRTQAPRPPSYLGPNRTREKARSRGYLPHTEQEETEGYASSPEVPRNSHPWFEDEQADTTSGELNQLNHTSMSSYLHQNHTNCNQTMNMNSWNEYPNIPITGTSYNPGHNLAVDCCCCSYTNVYSTCNENGLNTPGYQCEHAYTSGNPHLQPYHPFPGPCS